MAYQTKERRDHNGPVPADDATSQALDTLSLLLRDPEYRTEISARWSNDRGGIVVVVQARRETTPDEQARLIEIMAQAGPNDLATVVFERWRVTLDRPLDYIAETVISASNVPIDLRPSY